MTGVQIPGTLLFWGICHALFGKILEWCYQQPQHTLHEPPEVPSKSMAKQRCPMRYAYAAMSYKFQIWALSTHTTWFHALPLPGKLEMERHVSCTPFLTESVSWYMRPKAQKLPAESNYLVSTTYLMSLRHTYRSQTKWQRMKRRMPYHVSNVLSHDICLLYASKQGLCWHLQQSHSQWKENAQIVKDISVLLWSTSAERQNEDEVYPTSLQLQPLLS